MSETDPIKLTEKQITCLRHLREHGPCHSDTPNCSRQVLGKLNSLGLVCCGSSWRWCISIKGDKCLKNHDRAAKP